MAFSYEVPKDFLKGVSGLSRNFYRIISSMTIEFLWLQMQHSLDFAYVVPLPTVSPSLPEFGHPAALLAPEYPLSASKIQNTIPISQPPPQQKPVPVAQSKPTAAQQPASTPTAAAPASVPPATATVPVPVTAPASAQFPGSKEVL